MFPGVRVMDLKKNVDERGFFTEVIREDWKDFLGDERIKQVSLSMSYPKIVRAWHRHAQGQVDYFVILKGAIKICLYDDQENSETRGQIHEVIASEEKLQVVRVPGHYWHGFKIVSNEPVLMLYLVTNLYDYKNPDELRRPWNDPSIIDPRTGEPYDWERPPHK